MEKNTEQLDLSIVIPVYNTSATFVKECLDSISAAKIRYSYEIIIVNDGSTDSKLIVFLNESHDNFISVIHKENTGVSASRNLGMKQAKGKFLICLDADDLLTPNINKAIDYLEKNRKYDAVYCDLQYFGDTRFLYKKNEFSKFQLIYIGSVLTPSSTLLRREIFSKVQYNEKLSYSEDKDFFSRAAVLGFKFKYFHKPFCLYRKIYGNKSLSQKNIKMKDETEIFIKSQFDPHKEITIEEVNKYVIHNFAGHKKYLVKLLLILFFPKLFDLLLKRKIFKNNIVID
ncbi:MAG: glycosyltransferase family 2 protein [Flavobacteriaceae bacterium]|jgi:glycosyltransferase involved in cell wall biosynthesis|nr:glycosyltransferase family 2 protein [Flavobacteriaceae bacterium]